MVEHSWAAAVSVRAMAHGRISDTLGIWLPHHQTKSVVMIAFVVEKIAVIKSPLDLRHGEQFSHTHTRVTVCGDLSGLECSNSTDLARMNSFLCLEVVSLSRCF